MNELEKWEASGVFKAISKKEASRLTKELARLQKLLGGIRDMKVLPDVVFVIDPVDTMGAVRESHVLGIPVIAVCDTNADPDLISLPVPGNDDAARSIKLFCGAIADSILEGRAEVEAAKTTEATPADPENPTMAKAFESAMLEAEKAEEAQAAQTAPVVEVVEEVVVEEAPVAEVKKEAEEKPAKKAAAKKTTTKKTTAKKTTETKTAAKKTTAKKTTTKAKKADAKEETK